jgi:biotinidase
LQIVFHPFLFSPSPAVQVQQGYAYSNNVVLLAAGGNFPLTGQAGSGIYIGKHGATGVIMPGEITQ